MDWYPLRLSTPVTTHVFGGRRIPEQFGRADMPDGRVAETWEVSDVEDRVSYVLDGPLAGRSLRELTRSYPDELVAPGWRGPRFPLLTKYIDASHMLPVHLHADDATARRLEGQPNGKTEAWHILWAAPGASALAGLKDGVDREALRDALWRQDWDAVLRRLPVRAGQTIYVPGGTLHSFGPDTVIYEVEQASNIQQHAMPWHMEDGSPVGHEELARNIAMLLQELRPEPRPDFRAPLSVRRGDGVEQTFCCAGPYFALERWHVSAGATASRTFAQAVLLSNAGEPVAVRWGRWSGTLARAASLLLPAALGRVEFDGPADVLAAYVPDLDRDVRQPLLNAGHGPRAIAQLGESLGG